MELTKTSLQSTARIGSGPGGGITRPRVNDSKTSESKHDGTESVVGGTKSGKSGEYLHAEIRDGHGVIVDGPKRDRDTLIRSIKDVLKSLSTDKTSGASNPKLLFLQDVCRIFKLPTTIGNNSILNESIVTEELERSPILSRINLPLDARGKSLVDDGAEKQSSGDNGKNRTSVDAKTKVNLGRKIGANLVRKQSIPAVSNPLKSEHVDPNSIFYSTEPIVSASDGDKSGEDGKLEKPKPKAIGSWVDEVKKTSSTDSTATGDGDRAEQKSPADRTSAQDEMSLKKDDPSNEDQVEEFTEY